MSDNLDKSSIKFSSKSMTFEGIQSNEIAHVHEKKHRVETIRIEGKQGPMLNHFEKEPNE